ncbi:carbohydrate ABC transporter permease [Paenactinomyces guangxiensis]|uniref:carbohydrate ABC transporter permease n=1 Tax=Paenactinomyces guangxiensis TaxID=1490290 RepID=UPI0018DCD283|nr:sugar ABC transporter permease [Paenactinomyces guangxiensis]MBH8589904.1 sugar ABC transporter permease [Paenactinomyces guangxiensis]
MEATEQPQAAPLSPAVKHGSKRSKKHRKTVLGYLFLSPTLLFFLIFFAIPLAFSFYLSFTEWSGFDLSAIQWVGLKNYQKVLSPDQPFLHPVLTNTLVFAVGSVLLSFAAAVMFAYMITRLRFEGFWRTLYFFPMVTTVVAVGNVWKYMYDPHSGMINGLLGGLGLPPIRFLNDPDTALSSIIVVSAWAGIGSAVLILTAGLKAIPESYYEAAVLEGANATRLFWYITLPLLRPSMLFVLITGFISGLQSFTLTMVMTGDGGLGMRPMSEHWRCTNKPSASVNGGWPVRWHLYSLLSSLSLPSSN